MTGSVQVASVARDAHSTLRCLVLAFLSSFVVAIAFLAVAPRSGEGMAALVVPGATGPSAAVFRLDFPHIQLPSGSGDDGQQFYAIARQPMHPTAAASALDRPRYRLQRILLPVLAWSLHPQGGGGGLAIAVFAVAALGSILVGFGGSWLLAALGAPGQTTARAALLLPALPGVLASVGVATPDALALGLALVAMALDERGHLRAAVIVAVLAVLAKESLFLVLVGWVLWRGLRSVWLVAAPAVVAAGWWLVLRITVPDTPYAVREFEPVGGLVRSVRHWADTGTDLVAAAVVVASLTLAVLAFRRRGLRSPFGPAIALQFVFVLCLAPDVIGVNWNSTRATLPLMVLALLALATPASASRLEPGLDTAPRSRRLVGATGFAAQVRDQEVAAPHD